MSDFVESAKHFVNAAVSRTSWEAQKQLRVRGKQSEIDKLMAQRRQLLEDMAEITMKLYQQGALTDPQLSRLCASVFELDNDVKNREGQLQEIKSEVYPSAQNEPAPTPSYTPPTPASPPPAASKRPGPGAGAGTGAAPQSQVCPTCGSALRRNALYCRSCGTKLR